MVLWVDRLSSLRASLAEGFERAFARRDVVDGVGHVTCLDDVVARIQFVMHSNDAVARAATLRVLGAMAPLLRTRLTVHHTVVKSVLVAALALQEASEVGDDALPHCEAAEELCCGLHAAGRIAEHSAQFSRTLLPVLRMLLFGSVKDDATPTVKPVHVVTARCACVEALHSMARDPVLVAEAQALCLRLGECEKELVAVRCKAFSTLASLTCRVSLGLDDVLTRIRTALVSSQQLFQHLTEEMSDGQNVAVEDEKLLLKCLVESYVSLLKESLIPSSEDVRVLENIAVDMTCSEDVRIVSVRALATIVKCSSTNEATLGSISRVLTLCTSESNRKNYLKLAKSVLCEVSVCIDYPLGDLASIYNKLMMEFITSLDESENDASLLEPCVQVLYSERFKVEWRKSILESAITRTDAVLSDKERFKPTLVQALSKFISKFALAAEKEGSLFAEQSERFVSLSKKAFASISEDDYAKSSFCVVESSVIGLVVGKKIQEAEDILQQLLERKQYWIVYRVLRIAFCRGLFTLCSKMFPLLDVSLPCPFRQWITVLTLVSQAESLLMVSRLQTDDSDDYELRVQDVTTLLLRALVLLQNSVAPKASCSFQEQLLTLRIRVISALSSRIQHGSSSSALLLDASRKYHHLSKQWQRLIDRRSVSALNSLGESYEELSHSVDCNPSVSIYPRAFFILQEPPPHVQHRS